MEPSVVLLIFFSIILVVIAFMIPIIMSVLDPRNIPNNLRGYYSKKKRIATIIAFVIVGIIMLIAWTYVFVFALN